MLWYNLNWINYAFLKRVCALLCRRDDAPAYARIPCNKRRLPFILTHLLGLADVKRSVQV